MSRITRAYGDPLAPGVTVRIKDPYLSEGVYTEVVQKMPIPCTDVVLTDPNQTVIYLAKRRAYPMPGVWCIGGRIQFNDETLEASAARCLVRETKVTIDPSRLKYTGTPHFYSWVKTAQGDTPGKNLVIPFKLCVEPDEVRRMAEGLDEKEYDPGFGLQEYDAARLEQEKVHPALVDLYNEICWEGRC